MTRSKAFVLLMAVLVASSVMAFAGDATPIPVTNNSFEDPTTTPGGWAMGVIGWNLNGVGGIYAPTSNIIAPTDGANVLWLNSGYVSQTLGTALAGNSSYTLSVDIGQRPDFGGVSYMVQLLAGGVVIAVDNNSLHPGSGSWMTSVLTYNVSGNNSLIGQNLEIRLFNTGTQQVTFDNVNLTDPPFTDIIPTPEPATLVLLGSGLVGCFGFRRRVRL